MSRPIKIKDETYMLLERWKEKLAKNYNKPIKDISFDKTISLLAQNCPDIKPKIYIGGPAFYGFDK